MKRKFLYSFAAISLVAALAYAQGSGTPSNLRVLIDSTGALVTAAVAQTLPLSQPIVFTQARLRTDSTGALVTTGGGSSSSSSGDPTRRITSIQISDTGEITMTAGKDGQGFNGTVLGSGISNNTLGALRLSFLFATTGTNNNTSGWANNGIITTRTEWLPQCTFKISTSTTIAVMKLWFGISSSSSLNTDTPTTTNIKFVGFRYSTAVPDTTWVADIEKGDGSNATRASTVVNVATSTFVTLKFDVVSTTSINFYVNGTLTNNLTTNVPTGTDMFPIIYMVTNENVVKQFLLNKLYCESN